MKNYCYICLLTACMAPMSLQAKKAIPYSGEVCVASLPTVPTTLPGISSDSYARRFADSEMLRFPKAYQLDHGKRLFFGYSQGVGCCAMLDMWKNTGDKRYFTYVEEWADSLINEKGEIHLYDMSTYNLDYINSGKVLFDLYKETGKEKIQSSHGLTGRTTQKTTTYAGRWLLA